jgi:hypothetical protein
MLLAPAPLLASALTSNLPPASSSQPGSTAEAVADRIVADFDAGVSLAPLVDDLAQICESSAELAAGESRR